MPANVMSGHFSFLNENLLYIAKKKNDFLCFFLLLCLYGNWLHKSSANGHVLAMVVQSMEAGESLYGERHKEGSMFNMVFIL